MTGRGNRYTIPDHWIKIIYPAFNTVESTYQNIHPFHNILYLTRNHHMAIIFQMTWANHNFYAVFLRTISKRTPIRPIPIIFVFICGIRNNGKCYFNALFVQLKKCKENTIPTENAHEKLIKKRFFFSFSCIMSH